MKKNKIVTMCNGGDCPKKYICKRYIQQPINYQLYFSQIPFTINKNNIFKCRNLICTINEQVTKK